MLVCMYVCMVVVRGCAVGASEWVDVAQWVGRSQCVRLDVFSIGVICASKHRPSVGIDRV